MFKISRRSFFKSVTGFVFGVYATFVPKAKAKHQPTKEEFQDTLTGVVREKLKRYTVLESSDFVCYYCTPAYILHNDGSIELIPYWEFYKC